MSYGKTINMRLILLYIVEKLLKVLKFITIKFIKIHSNLSVSNSNNINIADNIKNKFVNIIIKDKNIINKRWDKCLECEHLFKPTNTCKKCGCFMKMKTKFAGASCPIGKWDKEYNLLEERV